MSEPDDMIELLRADLSLGTGRQIGYGKEPVGLELNGQPLRTPYASVYPMTVAFRETSMVDPHDSVDDIIQVFCIGVDPRQTRWMANKAFEVITKRENGSYTYPLRGPVNGWEWRLCDQRGGILPTGPTLYKQQDMYRLRRGA